MLTDLSCVIWNQHEMMNRLCFSTDEYHLLCNSMYLLYLENDYLYQELNISTSKLNGNVGKTIKTNVVLLHVRRAKPLTSLTFLYLICKI